MPRAQLLRGAEADGDEAYVRERCDLGDFEVWARFIAEERNSPESTEEFTGVPAADVRAAAVENNDVLRELLIMSRVTGLVPEDLDCLHFDDYQQLQSVFR